MRRALAGLYEAYSKECKLNLEIVNDVFDTWPLSYKYSTRNYNTWPDILLDDLDVQISVRSGVLVVESQTVHYLK